MGTSSSHHVALSRWSLVSLSLLSFSLSTFTILLCQFRNAPHDTILHVGFFVVFFLLFNYKQNANANTNLPKYKKIKILSLSLSLSSLSPYSLSFSLLPKESRTPSLFLCLGFLRVFALKFCSLSWESNLQPSLCELSFECSILWCCFFEEPWSIGVPSWGGIVCVRPLVSFGAPSPSSSSDFTLSLSFSSRCLVQLRSGSVLGCFSALFLF